MREDIDRQELYARHLLLCDFIHHNPFRPGRSYSLEGVVNWLRPEDEYGYPLIIERLMLFTQIWGERGDYESRVDLFQLDDDYGTGQLIRSFGPRILTIHGNEFVETKGWLLHQVAFPNPGVFEFRLMAMNQPEPVVSERLYLREDYK